LNALKKVSENTLIPVFADESAVTLEDINRIISLSSAEGINIKLQKIGGILPALKAAERAFSQGFKIMVGCNEETHIAISAAIHLVAAMDGVVNTDLDSDIILFDFNITKENPLDTFINGARIPRNKPGLGVELANWLKNILEERIKIERVA
jgi:L-alanine-DL-glutamate epimerase-like enolase superfamily enzyme